MKVFEYTGVVWKESDEYVSKCPELGVASCGDTLEEAVFSLKEAWGFTGPLSGGRHQFVVKGELKVRIPNPQGSRDISDPLLKEILRQAGISEEKWDQK